MSASTPNVRALCLRLPALRAKYRAVRLSMLAFAAALLPLLVSFGAAAEEPATATAPREALPKEYPPPSARTTLAVTGSAVLVGWYGLALGASFLDPDAPGARDLRIPVVGPWMAVAQAGCNAGDPGCSKTWVVVRAILQAIDGVGQAGGLAVIGESLFLPTREPSARTSASVVPHVRAVPFVVGDALGVGFHGSF
jgi:hypothetical protein